MFYFESLVSSENLSKVWKTANNMNDTDDEYDLPEIWYVFILFFNTLNYVNYISIILAFARFYFRGRILRVCHTMSK